MFTATSGGQLVPSNLAMASSAGVGVIRKQLIQGTDADPVMTLAATAHLRVAPVLGLPQQLSPSDAASAMAQYVTSFAERYGPNGSFWEQNPTLPYLPVTRFEIGNEPNMPLQWVADETHLHWTDPAAYAQVYEAARAALHDVDPSGVAVVGGLADSAGGGVDLQSDEQWLAAITGPIDAVGYHPYTFEVSDSLMNADTEALRQWMNANGLAAVPLDINEFDACEITSTTTVNTGACPGSGQQSSGAWGAVAAAFTEWALCTPGLNVQAVLPFYWGGTPTADSDAWLTLTTTAGALTPYGQDYLAEAHALTTVGCPPVVTQPASGEGGGASAPGATAAQARPSAAPREISHIRLKVSRTGSRFRLVTVTAQIASAAKLVRVTARHRHHRVSLHRRRRRHHHLLAGASRVDPTVSFTARLKPGRWTITLVFVPSPGYVAPLTVARTITILV